MIDIQNPPVLSGLCHRMDLTFHYSLASAHSLQTADYDSLLVLLADRGTEAAWTVS